jgi:hypothetical protein
MTKPYRTQSTRRHGGSNGGGHHRIFDNVLTMARSLANSRKHFAAIKLESLEGDKRRGGARGQSGSQLTRANA